MSLAELDKLCLAAGEQAWRYSPAQLTSSELPEAQRLYTLAAEDIEQSKEVVFRHVYDVQAEVRKTTGRPGDAEISRFLRLIDLIHQVPWASATFDHNHKIILQLAASHLELLVDRKIARAHGPRLRALIGQHTRDSNLVWITNRQQGRPAPEHPVSSTAAARLTVATGPPGQDDVTGKYRRNQSLCKTP